MRLTNNLGDLRAAHANGGSANNRSHSSQGRLTNPWSQLVDEHKRQSHAHGQQT